MSTSQRLKELNVHDSMDRGTMLDAVTGLIARIFPLHQEAFVLEWIAPVGGGYDVFEVQGVEGNVVIR